MISYEIITIVVMVMMVMMMMTAMLVVTAMMVVMAVTQHIPTMTKPDHDGEMSVMIKVRMCRCQKPNLHHTP